MQRGRNLDRLIAQLAAPQAGVCGYANLRDWGISHDAVRARIAAGEWRRVGRTFITSRSGPISDEQWAWTLQLNAAPRAVVSGVVAVRLLGWDLVGTELIVLQSSHKRLAVPSVKVIRRREPLRFRDVGGLRLAPREEALADLIASVPRDRANAIVDCVLQRRWLDATAFDRILAERIDLVSKGASALRLARKRISSGSRSEAEQRMAVLLTGARVGSWRANVPLRDEYGNVVAELDFADVDLRIAIEVDGRAFHSDRHSFERDRRRQNLLVLDGWLVLRFTWEQITLDPEGVIATIRAAVRQRQAHVG